MEIHESKEKIRVRAHQLWEEAGRPHGYDLDHWLQAEKEQLLNSVAAAPLAEEARQEFSGAEPEGKPAKKAKTENAAPKTARKSSGRGKSK
jgi:hypothetical protein